MQGGGTDGEDWELSQWELRLAAGETTTAQAKRNLETLAQDWPACVGRGGLATLGGVKFSPTAETPLEAGQPAALPPWLLEAVAAVAPAPRRSAAPQRLFSEVQLALLRYEYWQMGTTLGMHNCMRAANVLALALRLGAEDAAGYEAIVSKLEQLYTNGLLVPRSHRIRCTPSAF